VALTWEAGGTSAGERAPRRRTHDSAAAEPDGDRQRRWRSRTCAASSPRAACTPISSTSRRFDRLGVVAHHLHEQLDVARAQPDALTRGGAAHGVQQEQVRGVHLALVGGVVQLAGLPGDADPSRVDLYRSSGPAAGRPGPQP
jgi:hypothetical protein